jgi:DNA-binding transcriptional ArsR family regulator
MSTEATRQGSGGAHQLDYELDDYVYATTPEQMKALGDPTRDTILGLLLERAATTSQLAEALNKAKGTVGYHLNVLADVGLIRVVRRRKVRALTEKYYGRVGRTIVFRPEHVDRPRMFMLEEALQEAVHDPDHPLPLTTVRRVRIPVERAVEFSQRVIDLAEDFVELPRGGDTVYGFVAGVYPTDLPVLADNDAESE